MDTLKIPQLGVKLYSSIWYNIFAVLLESFQKGITMIGIGERLKRLRVEKGYTQRKLGNLLGVRNSIISFYEVRERQPSLGMVVKTARTFGVSSDYILGITGDRSIIDTRGLSEAEIIALCRLADRMRAK
ncbi:MAG: helix-turn-helix transcriptional regulator [Lachnospiraceae bacterium]|nr:helix-turn-helix transcriptional regulator [Lachnospiraceae bacterium]